MIHKGRRDVNRSRTRIVGLVDQDLVIISSHARVRMFERNISTDDLFFSDQDW